MNNFNWTTFTKKIAVKTNLSAIYKAWTNVNEIEKWFLSKAVFIDANNMPIGNDTSIEKGFK